MMKNVHFACCIALVGSLLCVSSESASERSEFPKNLTEIINSYLGYTVTLKHRDIAVYGPPTICKQNSVRLHDPEQPNGNDDALCMNFIEPLPRESGPSVTNEYYVDRVSGVLTWQANVGDFQHSSAYSMQNHTAAMQRAIDDALNSSIAAEKRKSRSLFPRQCRVTTAIDGLNPTVETEKQKSRKLRNFLLAGTLLGLGLSTAKSLAKVFCANP